MYLNEYITYEMFGAVGDGVHDDMPAIAAAHAEANRLHLPVRAKEGASYYISPKAVTARVMTDTCWEGAKFIIDDRDCEDIKAPVFLVESALSSVALPVKTLAKGQTQVENPHGCDLYVLVKNSNQKDFIRFGLNQDNGSDRTDAFIVRADGTLGSPVAYDFEEITELTASPIDETTLHITGGAFLTIANQAESRYNYHSRNIEIRRSNVDIGHIRHDVTGETDHGAPYRGFISVCSCADVTVHDMIFTAHYIYVTIGSAGLPVKMGSYDINVDSAVNITFRNCTQTTDIHDDRYWGLIGSNYCRDLLFEDCTMSRFDAHKGVTNCTIRRCNLGWQGLNAIGHGLLEVEDTSICGRALISLRPDYGGLWDGDMILKNCVWKPARENRVLFEAENDGHHYFGFDCCFPHNITVDGLTVEEDAVSDAPLYLFSDYLGEHPAPVEERKYLPEEAKTVRIRNIRTNRPVKLCSNAELFKDTVLISE